MKYVFNYAALCLFLFVPASHASAINWLDWFFSLITEEPSHSDITTDKQRIEVELSDSLMRYFAQPGPEGQRAREYMQKGILEYLTAQNCMSYKCAHIRMKVQVPATIKMHVIQQGKIKIMDRLKVMLQGNPLPVRPDYAEQVIVGHLTTSADDAVRAHQDLSPLLSKDNIDLLAQMVLHELSDEHSVTQPEPSAPPYRSDQSTRLYPDLKDFYQRPNKK